MKQTKHLKKKIQIKGAIKIFRKYLSPSSFTLESDDINTI